MALFKIEWRKSAEAELLQVPFPHRRLLNQRLMKLKHEPLPGDEQDADWQIIGGGPPEKVRLRAFGWKVLYEVDVKALSVVISAVLADRG